MSHRHCLWHHVQSSSHHSVSSCHWVMSCLLNYADLLRCDGVSLHFLLVLNHPTMGSVELPGMANNLLNADRCLSFQFSKQSGKVRGAPQRRKSFTEGPQSCTEPLRNPSDGKLPIPPACPCFTSTQGRKSGSGLSPGCLVAGLCVSAPCGLWNAVKGSQAWL
jgi:hypothetical protein